MQVVRFHPSRWERYAGFEEFRHLSVFLFEVVRKGVPFRSGRPVVDFKVLVFDQRDAYGLAPVSLGVIPVQEAADEFLGLGVEHAFFHQLGVLVVAVAHMEQFIFLAVINQAGRKLSEFAAGIVGDGDKDVVGVVSALPHSLAVGSSFKIAARTVLMLDQAGGRGFPYLEFVLSGLEGGSRQGQRDDEKQGRCFHDEKSVSDLLK